MKYLPPRFAMLLAALLPLECVWAQSIRELTLNDVLNVALQQVSATTQGGAAQGYQSSAWLAALPSVSFSYIDSNKQDGSNEAQVSLNLPIKSGVQRRADKQLKRLSTAHELVSKQHERLYFSGLIREAAWSYKVAEVKRNSAGRKLKLLNKLVEQYQQLLAANAVSEYSLLLIEKELMVVQIEQQGHQQQLKRWLQQFQIVTGLGSIPAIITEPQVNPQDYVLAQHPQLQLLELAWSQKQQALMASSNQATPWNVSLVAKNIDSAEFEEDQYGIEIEIPLSFINAPSQSHNSEWRLERRNFTMAMDELRQQLQHSWDLLAGESVLLQRKNILLARSGELSARITRRASELEAANELDQELILRQMIETIDAKASIAINQILIEQNNAMRRQAAGIPL